MACFVVCVPDDVDPGLKSTSGKNIKDIAMLRYTIIDRRNKTKETSNSDRCNGT